MKKMQRFGLILLSLFLIPMISLHAEEDMIEGNSNIQISQAELEAAAGKGPLQWGPHVIEVTETSPGVYQVDAIVDMSTVIDAGSLTINENGEVEIFMGNEVVKDDKTGNVKHDKSYYDKDGNLIYNSNNIAKGKNAKMIGGNKIKTVFEIDTNQGVAEIPAQYRAIGEAAKNYNKIKGDWKDKSRAEKIAKALQLLNEGTQNNSDMTEFKNFDGGLGLERAILMVLGEIPIPKMENKSFNFITRVEAKIPKPDPNKIKPTPGAMTCAEWLETVPNVTVNCKDGSATTEKGCAISQYEVPTGSYERRTPLPTPPTRNDPMPCFEGENKGFVGFVNLEKPAFVYGEAKIEATKPEHIAKLLNNRTFSGVVYKNPAFQYDSGEVRTWNPTRSDVVLTGLPYKELYSPEIDSWLDPNHSQVHSSAAYIVYRAERQNARVARQFGVPSLNIYQTAPKGKMEIGYISPIDGKWKTYESNNKYCKEMYEILIKPEIRVDIYTTYDVYHIHEGSASIPSGCYCAEWSYKDERYCKEYKKEWGCISGHMEQVLHWVNNKPRYKWEYICDLEGLVDSSTCDKWDTKPVKDKCIKELPNITQKSHRAVFGPTPTTKHTGSYIIPPIYETRVRWHYRTGAEVEFHTKTTPLHPQARLTPNIPNADGSIKSGYGVKYSDGYKIETDYDQSRLKYNVWTIRPNRTVNLDPRASQFSQVGVFREDIEYNPDTRKPTASSSSNAFTYIMEKIKGRTLDDKVTLAKEKYDLRMDDSQVVFF